MTEVAAVIAISGKGFVGDASFGRRNRLVLLIDSETVNELGIKPSDSRQNVTLEGFEASGLSPQDDLRIGEIRLAVTGACGPCSKLDELRPGLSSDVQGRRGALARVVRGGRLQVDDLVSLARGEPATSAP